MGIAPAVGVHVRTPAEPVRLWLFTETRGAESKRTSTGPGLLDQGIFHRQHHAHEPCMTQQTER